MTETQTERTVFMDLVVRTVEAVKMTGEEKVTGIEVKVTPLEGGFTKTEARQLPELPANFADEARTRASWLYNAMVNSGHEVAEVVIKYEVKYRDKK